MLSPAPDHVCNKRQTSSTSTRALRRRLSSSASFWHGRNCGKRPMWQCNLKGSTKVGADCLHALQATCLAADSAAGVTRQPDARHTASLCIVARADCTAMRDFCRRLKASGSIAYAAPAQTSSIPRIAAPSPTLFRPHPSRRRQRVVTHSPSPLRQSRNNKETGGLRTLFQGKFLETSADPSSRRARTSHPSTFQ
jgi:hypothetical protein